MMEDLFHHLPPIPIGGFLSCGFEIIIPHRIEPSRILRVLRDRPPRHPRRDQYSRSRGRKQGCS